MVRSTYGPIVVAQPTPSTTDDPTALGFSTAAIPVSRTRGGTPEIDLVTFAAGTANADGTVTPDASTGAVGVSGPDGYQGLLWLGGFPMQPNELPDRVGGVSSVAVNGGTAQTGAATVDTTPPDASVTNAKVSSAAAISLDKTANSATRLALTSAQSTKLGQINLTGMVAGQLLEVSADGLSVVPVSQSSLPFVLSSDLPSPLVATIKLATGAPLPAGLSAQTLIARTATSTLGFSGVVGTAGVSSVGTAGATVTTTTAIAAGQRVVVAIGASGEGTGAATVWTVTAASGVTLYKANQHIEGSNTQSAVFHGNATAAIPVGTVFTVAPDTARSDVDVVIASLDGIVAVGALDQTTTNGSGVATDFSVGPTGLTTVSNEIVLAAFLWRHAEEPFTATGGWTQAGATIVSTDTDPRALAVVYKVLTSTGTPTATGSISAPTGGVLATSSYSATMATFKGA